MSSRINKNHQTRSKEKRMKKLLLFFSLIVLGIAVAAVPGSALAAATISASEYKAGDSVTIADSGGVGTFIEWTLSASDGSGNVAASRCQLQVANPGKGKAK